MIKTTPKKEQDNRGGARVVVGAGSVGRWYIVLVLMSLPPNGSASLGLAAHRTAVLAAPKFPGIQTETQETLRGLPLRFYSTDIKLARETRKAQQARAERRCLVGVRLHRRVAAGVAGRINSLHSSSERSVQVSGLPPRIQHPPLPLALQAVLFVATQSSSFSAPYK